MTFEDRLLAELKTEVAGRAARRRGTARWWARPRPVAVAIAAVAALTAVAVPTLIGSEATAAYAVTRNADGSITVTIKEFREADRLQRELAGDGVRTDITYLPQHKRCAGVRGTEVDSAPPPHQPLVWPERERPVRSFKISPQLIEPGRTLVLELAESHRTKLWKLKFYLVTGPVGPCVFENDPYWN
ncbi:hypothetical protein [Actinoallomurus oryzae]|uniref:hypothetical protein n=1 Tax=Actinoallomurus oryzae TaxID=502180 RepID=UPI0031E9BC44